MAQDIIMACLTRTSQDSAILRTAQRQAKARNLPWCAVYLELWEDQKGSRATTRNRALEQVALAERMGAVSFITKAADYQRGFAEALAECSRRNFSPKLVIAGGADAKSPPSVKRSVAAIEDASIGHFELLFVTPGSQEARPKTNWLTRLHMRRLDTEAAASAVFAVAMAYLISQLLKTALPSDVLNDTNIYLVFLISVAAVAGHYGLLPGLISAVAALITIKLFYIPPLYSLYGAELNAYTSLGLFLLTAIVVSIVNSQVQAEAEASETNQWRMQALLQVYKISLHAKSRNEALAELHENLHQFLHAEIAVFMPSLSDNKDNLQAVWPEVPGTNADDVEILTRCWKELQKGNCQGEDNPKTGWRFLPLTGAAGDLGMLALRVPPAEATDVHFEQYLRTIAEMVASILEKIESVDIKEESRVRVEREKLRTRLLSSVSHDLKTPLASMIGALSVHRTMYDKLPEEQRRELTDAALIEAQRLDSFITNILDLAKIESGAITFKRQWQTPEDLVQRVKKRMRMRFESHHLEIVSPATSVEVEMDPVISEQALMNVLDNAVKYTPKNSRIEIRMETGDEAFYIRVRDHGPGIPEADQERVFDKYTRLQRQDTQVAGTGLGLALARAAMRGQGGEISVENHPEGGAVFTLCWPQWRVAAATSSMRRNAMMQEAV